MVTQRVTPYLSFNFQVAENTAALSCGCIWRVKDDDFDLSIKLIAEKRLRLEDERAKIRGVHFFISSLTGITSNAIGSSAKKAAGKRDKPCHIFVVNAGQFLSKLQSICNELNNDGLQIHLKGNLEGSNDDPLNISFEPISGVLGGIEKLANTMKVLGHALYKGDLYGIPPGTRYTYVYMMDIDTYLHKMMANDKLREYLVKHGDRIATLLKHPACQLIEQIEFDFDLIEVMLPCGTCFRISERKFVHEPISDDDVGKVSPRMYVLYDSSTPPNPKYFRESILNSFPEDYDRTNFLNKF